LCKNCYSSQDGNVLLEGRETAGKLPLSNRIFTRLSVHRNAAFSDGEFRSDSNMLKVGRPK
jgi:hypothetical protein